jgi:hypothetical protein
MRAPPQALVMDVESACRIYRPRDLRKTALWGFLDTLYERVKGQWEERFERQYGVWRGLADEAVARYLDCGSQLKPPALPGDTY